MALKHDELDTLIDDVARRMIAGEPGAEFTSSVLARLDERRSIWRSPWLLSPIAAAAVVLIAVFVWRGGPPREVRLKPDATSHVAEGPALQAERTSTTAPQPSAVRLTPDTTGRWVVQGRDPIPSDIDALTVASIAVEQLEPVPLSPMDSIDANPLTITAITLPPLDSGDDIQRRFE